MATYHSSDPEGDDQHISQLKLSEEARAALGSISLSPSPSEALFPEPEPQLPTNQAPTLNWYHLTPRRRSFDAHTDLASLYGAVVASK